MEPKLRWKIAQKAEIRWWRNYLKKKPKTEYLGWKKKYWTKFIQRAGIKFDPEDRILDAGCGPAGVFMVLDGYEVEAVDPLVSQYETNLPHFSREDYPSVRFFNQPLEDFNPEQPFNKLFCLNALNHVNDIDKVMDRLCSWVKPGGKVYLSIDSHNHAFFKFIFRLLPGDILHPHQFNLVDYRLMAEKRGLTIRKTILIKQGFLFSYYLIIAEKPSMVDQN